MERRRKREGDKKQEKEIIETKERRTKKND